MATGDQNDMIGRLRALLPQGWFPSDATLTPSAAPVLHTILSGFAAGLAWCYAFIQFALAQVLIGTSTDIWLDLHAFDFFQSSLLRRQGESDASFRGRVFANLFPPGNTRAAIIERLTSLTGTAPTVFEPMQPMDTGAYGYGALGYGVAGGYGSLALPFQAFVTVTRNIENTAGNLAGYNGQLTHLTIEPGEVSPGVLLLTNTGQDIQFEVFSGAYAPGGYGVGSCAYIDPSMAFAGADDNAIYETVAATEPAGYIVWTRIIS